MPTFFQRPENALKRAHEFIDVGKKQRALDALYDVIKSKKHRTWQKIHEPIMEKYLELCVELKKSHIAKEGLYQYKNICQQVNIKSLEDVVRKYLSMAEQKTEEARQESHQTVVDVDDLDVLQTPENLLLSAVSGEDTQDRTDRAILTPWVKFLWESYRQCLDLLRNNNSVEKLYQDIAQQAFKFCLKYARKTEFRKLCDNLRTHLGHIHKHQNQQRAINLNNPDSQAMHLETRLVQLDSAIQMELWQEAFKAVEDIHGLITLSKKPPKPSLMANYYQKLGLVFWKSGNHMYHACAWHRLFHLSREQRKNLSHDELQKLATSVMCATLSVPIPPSRNKIDSVLDMDDNTMEKQRRLATLLGLNAPPTRAGLVKDLLKLNVMQFVHPELQNLYRYLELEFHPLTLSVKVAGSLEFIAQNPDLECYVPALQEITITRLVKQISQVYQTIEFARLAKLAPFANQFRLERIIVDAAKNLELQVRIDHKTESLSFGTDLGVAQKEDVPEGPYLQSMPSEQIRNQLTQMAQALDKAMTIISPKEIQQMKREELRMHIVQTYRQTAKKDHLRILQRRQIIEERKEELEQVTVQKEREEAELLEDQKRRQIEAEMARLEREAEERERQRKMEEHKEIQRKVAKERLEQLKSTTLGARAFADLSEDALADMDVDDILAKQVEQLEKEKKELQEKLKSQEKKIDYFERAKRIEEIPLWEMRHEEDQVTAKQIWEIEEAERIEDSKKEREVALQHRDRLSRIIQDKDEFINKLRHGRMSVYKEKLAKFEKDLAEERAQRLKDRKMRRKEERRQKWITEKEEEEQRKHDEELKRQREEEERLITEKREEEEREYDERLRKLEEIEERKRQREREIEEKLEAERRGFRRAEPRPFGGDEDKWHREAPPPEREDRDRPSAWRAPAREGGGWREREKQKTDRWKKSSVDEHMDSPRVVPDAAPAREEAWRERGPPRDALDKGPTWREGPPHEARRDDRLHDGRDPPPREDRLREGRGPPLDDRGPPSRDDRGPPRDDRGPPPRDEGPWRREREPPRDEGAWRRERDEQAPAREEARWRGGLREDRDSRGPPPRDAWRREERGDDRPRDDRPPRDDGWRREGDRQPPRDEWRKPPQRDDREEGGWRRAPPRESDGQGWRGGDRGDRGGRDEGGWRDRGPPSREERGPPPRDFDDRGPARGPPRDDWRRGDDRAPPPRGRDERDPPADSSWRSRDIRGSPSKDIRLEERNIRGSPSKDIRLDERMPPRPSRREEGDEGWTTVKR